MMSRNLKNDVDIRKRQIDTLKMFNDNVIEVSSNEYAVCFSLHGRLIKILVYLGFGFQEKPRLVVLPILNHPNVDQKSGELHNFPGLLNFTIHSDLGRVVQAIIRDFEKFSSPLLIKENQTQQTHQEHTNNFETLIKYELANFTLEELKQLNDDDQYLDDFVQELEPVKKLDQELDVLINHVKSLATENMSLQKQLRDSNERILEKQIKFKNLGVIYENLNLKYQEKSNDKNPQHIKEMLQISVSIADGECEMRVEEFLSGQIKIENFLSNYMAAKKLSQMRKAKEERLSLQLSALERAA